MFLVLGITCAHHILGVISVLAIIVIYNQSNVDYMEGFSKGSAGDKSMGVVSVMPATMPLAKPATMPAADKAKDDDKKPVDAKKAVAREGFNLIDRERVMQKGKRASDLIGVADIRQQSDAVEPNDPSCFADQAAQF